jgi:hypothetical protein
MAVCMVLLVAAGLLLRGLYYAQTVDPGFEIKGVATTFLDLSKQGYDQPHATLFMMRLRERIRGLPGVMEVAQAESAPLSHDFSVDDFTVPGPHRQSRHRIQPCFAELFFAHGYSHCARPKLYT